MASKKKPSPVLTERKEKSMFYNVSVATCIVYLNYSEFQGRRSVLPKSLGGTVQSHGAGPTGKAPQTKNLGLVVQASMPSAMTVYRISGHPLLTGLGQGQRELPVAFHICCLCFCAFLEHALLAGESERKQHGIAWVNPAPMKLLLSLLNFYFRI